MYGTTADFMAPTPKDMSTNEVINPGTTAPWRTAVSKEVANKTVDPTMYKLAPLSTGIDLSHVINLQKPQ
jgi:hypothetical protein